MYIICTYLTSYLSHLAQGTDLTEIARLGPKVSEEWAATHPLHSNCSTILTLIGRYIGVISLDIYLLKFVAILAFLAAFFVQSVRIVSMDYVKLILSHKILWRFPTANQSPKGADGDGSYGVVFGRYLGLTTCSDPGHRSDLQIHGDFTPCSCWMLDSRVHTNQMSSHQI